MLQSSDPADGADSHKDSASGEAEVEKSALFCKPEILLPVDPCGPSDGSSMFSQEPVEKEALRHEKVTSEDGTELSTAAEPYMCILIEGEMKQEDQPPSPSPTQDKECGFPGFDNGGQGCMKKWPPLTEADLDEMSEEDGGRETDDEEAPLIFDRQAWKGEEEEGKNKDEDLEQILGEKDEREEVDYRTGKQVGAVMSTSLHLDSG